jgi:4,5-DOPA dioxygenase extradiol
MRYPAPGSAALAKRVAEIVSPQATEMELSRGLDHGAWGVLAPMYPQADIPVVQLSLDTRQPASHHHRIGQALNPLRDEGVLVVGSGNIVHNLRTFDPGAEAATDWAQRFNATVKQRIAGNRHQDLIDYENLGPDAALAVPTREHYLPLLYVLALARPGERIGFFNDRVISSISMTSVVVGGL